MGKNKWLKVMANKNQIVNQTCSAVLFKLPKSKFRFWHPIKCCKDKGWQVELLYTSDWTFKIFRNGEGKYNRFEKIEEKEIDIEEFESYYVGKDCE